MNTSRHSTTYLFNKSMNYNDTDLLGEYTTEQGKILPRRITGLSAKKQKQITKSIKRARMLSLMPFSNK